MYWNTTFVKNAKFSWESARKEEKDRRKTKCHTTSYRIRNSEREEEVWFFGLGKSGEGGEDSSFRLY